MTDSWFDPLPLREFAELNKLSGENVPEECPTTDPSIEGIDLRCGPILRLAGTLENNENNYRGSAMIVVKGEDIPVMGYKIGPSEQNKTSEKPQPSISLGEFPGTIFYQQDGFSFIRYTIELELVSYGQRVQYYINNQYKKSFQFFIPAVDESMNIMSFSCNGFSLGTDTSEYKSSLWLDVLNKHDTQHYHVMLGGGDQIYADSVKLYSEQLQKWMDEPNPIRKRGMKALDSLVSELSDYYLNHYLAWFGKGYWKGKGGDTLQALFPLAMSQIPSVNIYDDHDIIDGFGSYHDSTMANEIFNSVGNVAYKYYMLFQHQINPEEKLHGSDPSWIANTQKGKYIKQHNHSNYLRLGREISLLGLDCRTERDLKQIISPKTYSAVFTRLKQEITLTPEVKHLLVMLGVPIFYPRLVWLEWLLTSTLFKPLRKLATKGVINKGLVNEFDGDVEVLDDLNDHWCSKHHKRERNQLVRDLVNFGAGHGVRITILSGDVHLCCIGRLKSKYHHHPHTHATLKGEDIDDMNLEVTDYPERDPRLIFNVISSAIINAPPPDAMATLLNKRSKIHRFDKDTDEDVLPIFHNEVDGSKRENHRFLNKRNWSDLIIAKQSKYALKLPELDEGQDETKTDVIRKLPQPILDSKAEDYVNQKKTDDIYVKYPLFSDSLVTTLHVEQDPLNYDAPTASYEVLIPKLIGSYELQQQPVKHLGNN